MNFHLDKDYKKYISYSPKQKYAESYKEFPPGLYKLLDVGNMLTGFIPEFEIQERGDALIEFEKGIMKDILDRLKDFFSEETKAKYTQLGVMHKLGIILYGKPGVGKTALAKLIMLKAAKDYGAICLDCTKRNMGQIKYTIAVIRQFSKSPIIIFVDECEQMMNYEDSLTYLDGIDSVEDSIFIGATNYQKKIPDRIINRKSRIKFAYPINALPPEVYLQYIKDKLPDISKEAHAEFGYKAEEAGLTIDQLKNALINYHIDKMTIDASIKEVQEVVEVNPEEETD